MVMISKDIIYKDDIKKDKWNDIEIEVKKYLTVDEYFEFIEMVVNGVFQKDSSYMPEAMDVVNRITTIAMYTDIELPDDPREQFDLVFRTDLYDWVMNRICCEQISSINRVISERVLMLQEEKENDIDKKMNELKSTVESLSSMLESISNGVTDEQMKELVDFLSSNNINEQKLVSAIFDEKEKRERTISE